MKVCIITVHKRSCRKVMFLHLSVSHSVHMGCVSQHALGQTPLGQTPPGQTLPGRYPPGRHLLGRHLLGRHPPAQCMLGYTHLPCPVYAGIHTPCQVHAGIHTPSPWQPLLRMVCILLECILVFCVKPAQKLSIEEIILVSQL